MFSHAPIVADLRSSSSHRINHGSGEIFCDTDHCGFDVDAHACDGCGGGRIYAGGGRHTYAAGADVMRNTRSGVDYNTHSHNKVLNRCRLCVSSDRACVACNTY